MIYKIMFFLIIHALAMVNFAKAQSFSIESFEGNKANINLYYEPGSGMLSVCYLRDTLRIDNYLSVDSVKVLDKVFLQVNYAKRGGSNEGFMNQLLIYVSNGKIGQALHVSSYSNYDLRPREYSLFKLYVVLMGHGIDAYKLTLHIHSEKRSQRNPKLNYNYNRTNVLSFDKKDKCFSNNHEYVSGAYTFHDLKHADGKMRNVKGEFPVVIIEKDKYYYINGDWFSRDKDHFYSVSL